MMPSMTEMSASSYCKLTTGKYKWQQSSMVTNRNSKISKLQPNRERDILDQQSAHNNDNNE